MTALAILLLLFMQAGGQQRPFSIQSQNNGNATRPVDGSGSDAEAEAERQLQLGIALTRQGQFQAAIPHLKAADGIARETFVVEFNLGLCYLGTHQLRLAIQTLKSLHGTKEQTAEIKNLLAQAYIGDHQQEKGWQAFTQAAALTPQNEKLYAFVSDACLEEGFYQLGIQVTETGLRNLPNSARLFLQRGLLRLRVEEFALARQDFEQAAKLSPASDIGYIATVQEALSAGDISSAIQRAREAIRAGHSHYMLLTMLGEGLLRAGASTSTPNELGEAQSALEQAASQQPGYSSAQISLGKIYLMEGRFPDAIARLELGRHLDPTNPAVYSNLASAYRHTGEQEKLRESLAMLQELNSQEAARLASADAGHNGVATGPPAH